MDYQQAAAALLEQLKQFRGTYALGYDVSNLTRRLIEELEAEGEEE